MKRCKERGVNVDDITSNDDNNKQWCLKQTYAPTHAHPSQSFFSERHWFTLNAIYLLSDTRLKQTEWSDELNQCAELRAENIRNGYCVLKKNQPTTQLKVFHKTMVKYTVLLLLAHEYEFFYFNTKWNFIVDLLNVSLHF